jgi:hypothetical protein
VHALKPGRRNALEALPKDSLSRPETQLSNAIHMQLGFALLKKQPAD